MRTNGGGDRDPLDRCYTDPALARAIVRWLHAEGLSKSAHVVEPSVGAGDFLSALLAEGHAPEAITVADLDPSAAGLGLAVRAGAIAVRGSFLDLVDGAPADTFAAVVVGPGGDADAVGDGGATSGEIDGAEAFVRAGLRVAPIVVYLLPLLLLGGSARYARGIFERLRHVEALSPRPRFHGPGVRSKVPGKKPGGAQMEYGIFVFDRVPRASSAWSGGHMKWKT